MIRGTTPTLELKVPEDKLDISTITSLLIPIAQRDDVIVLKDMSDVQMDYENNIIGVYLSEEETFGFEVGNAEIQLIYWIGESKMASLITKFRITKILYDKDTKPSNDE